LEGCAKRESTEELGLPSWGPDWSVPAAFKLGRTRYYRAAGASEAEFECHGEVLLVKGITVATVTDVSDEVPSAANYEEVLSLWRKWASSSATSGGSSFDKHCATLVCDSLRERYPERHALASGLEDARFILSLSKENLSRDHELLTTGQRSYLTDAVNYCRRRLCTTSKQHVGLVPSEAKAGDLVCVLLGLDMPVVLCEEISSLIRQRL